MSSFPERILLATDGSEDAALAARAAADVSRETGAGLHVVHAWQPVPSTRYGSFIQDQLKEDAEKLLDRQVKVIESDGGKVSGAHLRMDPVVDEVLDLAAELEAGLIVVGSRGTGALERLFTGSVSEGIVHHAACAVLIVRGRDAWPPARVVIGDDGSEGAVRAGELAAAMGRIFDARGLLLRVYPQSLAADEKERAMNPRLVDDELRRAERALLERAGKLHEVLGSRPRTRVAVGDAGALLVEASREDAPSLVAVGSRGLGRIGRMRLGSISTKVLRAAEGPVLIYPSRDL